MVFRIGHYYQHSSGEKIHVCGYAHTYTWGDALIAENTKGEIIPVGDTEEHAQFWGEIDREVFEEVFK